MSEQGNSADVATSLQEMPEEVASSHWDIDESLAAEEKKFFFEVDSQTSEINVDIDALKIFPAGPSTYKIPMREDSPRSLPSTSEVESKVLDVVERPKYFFEDGSQTSEINVDIEALKIFPAGPSTFNIPMLKEMSITSPSTSEVQCKVLDVDNLPKLSKLDVLKNKLYLGSAYGGTRMTTLAEPTNDFLSPRAGCSKEADDPQGAISDGLDVAGLPPVPTQKSSKLKPKGSWAKFKEIFKKKDEKKTDIEDEGASAEEKPKKEKRGKMRKK